MLMKTKELCEELNIHRVTLYRWIKKYPDFPAVKLGGNWKFDMDAVREWYKNAFCISQEKMIDGVENE